MTTSVLPFRDINLHASSSHYAFTSPSSPDAPTLVVDRPTGDLRLNNGTLSGARRISSIAGILGIIKLKLDKYIIVITKAQPMGRIRGHMVYKVAGTEFLPMRERSLHDHDEDTYLALLKELLRKGPMYFSYALDLTNSFQRQSQSDPSRPMWAQADDRFFWNRFIQSDLIDFSLGVNDATGVRYAPQPAVDPYILPVMYGMLRISPARVKSTSFTFALITRRSRHRGGTRYFSRGIDDHGNVSNYNETEQIAILNDATGGLSGFAGGQPMKEKAAEVGRDLQVFSFVQTRGSVPVYWAEVNNLKYTPKLQVRRVETALEAARKHFDQQVRIYGDNYLVNLVNQKGREQRVKEAYEELIRILLSAPADRGETAGSSEKIQALEPSQEQKQIDRLHYIYFDFHNETKGLKWHRAELLLDRLLDGLNQGGYFRGVEHPGLPGGQLDIRSLQGSVVRTNCMDCLDRTNVVQSMLGRWALTRQFTDAGILRPGEAANDDRDFENLFRNVWADNADVVSKAYSGTGALKTDFTRTGERTRAGMLQDLNNSITRYVRNNFLDGPRQDGFDVFLGTYLPPESALGSLQLFLDRRPLVVQSVPYLLAAGVFMILVSLFTKRLPDSAVWPLRLFVIFWLIVSAWSARFVLGHGMLYVNWPKLNTPAAGSEGYQDALIKARTDPIVGQFLPAKRHQRGYSNARLGFLEEGKTRIE
ncbi:putative phosphoinositide phosphatase [Aspergillus campestris IBT 28561]|uniref:Phosphoinositide phosphatase n=1 Tax=Aspergillus campestris (strain IBT 28561) TaxID=1392248 RepID=A0A2I1CWT7_ASPC2|nr:putative phosphoinositide phosphatase [Aspergillus campestris IBT 28561]PKY02094.1 putative phosphoinositide phosphatase [Aspergillus campestris IBT 28561]